MTIHFEGTLRSDEALVLLLRDAETFAEAHGWDHAPIDSPEVQLTRVRDDQDWDYVGPVRGLALQPHADCEPLRLEFDRDLYIQEFTKTQFAGVAVHIAIVELLRALERHFSALQVDDEGEYWDNSDARTLAGHFQAFYRALAGVLREHPGARVRVRLPSGRIAEVVT